MRAMDYQGGLNSESGFEEMVNFLIKKYDIKSIVETGTADGTGSTTIFARTSIPVKTIECNQQSHDKALKNLQQFGNVKAFWGYSLNLREMHEFIQRDDIYDKTGLDIIFDNPSPQTCRIGYANEIGNLNIEEDLLEKLGDIPERQIIFLDSAGGIGYLEFLKFLKFKNITNKILLLDDVSRVKHYRSYLHLQNMGKKLHLNSSKRWGWSDFTQNGQIDEVEIPKINEDKEKPNPFAGSSIFSPIQNGK